MERSICIHAHFYQPPRENPWLEAVERQDSAYPFHDWNERVTSECYAPNSAARILDGIGRIQHIINNYSRISFNFGPTLLSWMKDNAPQTYDRILESERESAERFGGHGSAMAQVYNHIIMPLANDRDKQTQVRWGLRDFESRFGRKPEGMWLAETAVDIASLETLAREGIKFTILAQHQAARVRKLGGRSWKDVSGARIDPSRAYLAKLPSGNKIALFFYDGPISQAVAFEKLLDSGAVFANRLENGFSDKRTWPQLMHIATDGETYGHHHKYGDMALAFALDQIDSDPDIHLTNYGQFLEKHPPELEVQIIEDTSWSCYHGVERWTSNCGCNTGRAGWNQEWRGPLRAALDSLRDAAARMFEEKGGALFKDPWNARDAYIDVVLDRSPDSLWLFFEANSRRPLEHAETVTALNLLEMQRHALLMYTSCGWFFDELSGLESVQVIQYAGRVVQLASEMGVDLETDFLEKLSHAKSNIPEFGDGAKIYNLWVKTTEVDLCKVGAHFAISTLFDFDSDHEIPKFCYDITLRDYRQEQVAGSRIGLGKAQITSKITRDCRDITFAAIHLGDQVLHAGVREAATNGDFTELTERVLEEFSGGHFPDVLEALDHYFDGMRYSLKSLFKDEQKRIIDMILTNTLQDAEASYHAIYEKHGGLMRFLKELDQPIPEVLRITTAFVLNTDLIRTFSRDPVDVVRISMLLELVKREGVRIDDAGVGFAAGNGLSRLMRRFSRAPGNLELLQRADILAALLEMLPFPVNYWEAQNIYYQLLQDELPARARNRDEISMVWIKFFVSLGEKLRVSVPEIQPAELPIAS